jgi:hypothetical protein
MKIFFTALSITLLLFFGSCDLFDNEPELPPITTEGKGTFGCYVNGALFLPDAPSGFGRGVRAEFLKNDTLSSVNIYATNSNAHKSLIIAVLDEPDFRIGYTYDLDDVNCCGIQYIDFSGIPSSTYRELIRGTIKFLKFDVNNPQKPIIAGTFEFSASSPDCPGTLNVTSGRFDISDVQ